MKKHIRIISLILCTTLLVGLFPSMRASGFGFEEIPIYVDTGDGAIAVQAIHDENDLYIRASDYPLFTKYEYDSTHNLFLIKGQKMKKAFKFVVIDTQRSRISINYRHHLEMNNYYEIDNDLYLPFSQLLPVLDASLVMIEGSTLHIANPELTMGDVFYDFDIRDYYYNIDKEFNGNGFLASSYVLVNYFYTTIVRPRVDRFDVVLRTGDMKDYQSVFVSFLEDDKLYYEAMGGQAPLKEKMVILGDDFSIVPNTFHSLFDWIETIGESELDENIGGRLFREIKKEYDPYDIDLPGLRDFSTMWSGSDWVSFADMMKAVRYVGIVQTKVQDNYHMLSAVYDFNDHKQKKSTEYKAAKHVYDLYGNDVAPAIAHEAGLFSIKKGLEFLNKAINPYVVYTETAELAGRLLDAAFPQLTNGNDIIHFYASVANTAAGKFASYSTSTDDDTNNKRLSLLLCLKASLKCYENMRDGSRKSARGYYDKKINKIQEMIIALYYLGNNTYNDSFEHFEERKNLILSELVDASLLMSKTEDVPKEDEQEYIELTDDVPYSLEELSEAIRVFDTVSQYGFACSFSRCDWEEEERILNMIFDDGIGFASGVLHINCCHSIEEAKAHLNSAIGEKFFDLFDENQLIEIDGALYAIEGANGYGGYWNDLNAKQVTRSDQGTLHAAVNYYNSGGEILQIDEIELHYNGNKYVVSGCQYGPGVYYSYEDRFSQRAYMEISCMDGGYYKIRIHWSSSASSGGYWDYICTYDAGMSAFVCDGDATFREYEYREDEYIEEIVYEGKDAIIKYENECLHVVSEDVELENCIFEYPAPD